MVYFVRAASGEGLIKIGYTRDSFLVRMESLQRGSPVPLIALAVIDGERDDEHALHERFEAERVYGEWFSECSALLAVIEDARKSTPSELLGYRRPDQPRKCRQVSPSTRAALSRGMREWWRQQKEGARMYGAKPKNRGPIWPELDAPCPTCKAKKGEPCERGGETTELPHDRRVQAAEAAA